METYLLCEKTTEDSTERARFRDDGYKSPKLSLTMAEDVDMSWQFNRMPT